MVSYEKRGINSEGLRICFDVRTPKQMLFFERIIRKLSEKNNIIITSNHTEITELAGVRNVSTKIIKMGFVSNSISGMTKHALYKAEFTKIIGEFKPDLIVSFCSDEASRLSSDLDIVHVGFGNMSYYYGYDYAQPASNIDKLLVPKHIPEIEFAGFGIPISNIIQYNTMDEYVILNNSTGKPLPSKLRQNNKRTILFKPYESQQSYGSGMSLNTIDAVKTIAELFPEYNVAVLCMYEEQIKYLRQELGNKIIVLDDGIDKKAIFAVTDVLVGSGGMMTSEAVMRGVLAISYESILNIDEKYLISKGLMSICSDYKKLPQAIEMILSEDIDVRKVKIDSFLGTMEDPYDVLESTIKHFNIQAKN